MPEAKEISTKHGTWKKKSPREPRRYDGKCYV